MNIELEYYQTIVDDKLPMKIVKAELKNLINAVEAERYNSSECQMQTLVSKYSVFEMIDCEIDCVKSGNRLTPYIKDLVVESLTNVKKRIDAC